MAKKKSKIKQKVKNAADETVKFTKNNWLPLLQVAAIGTGVYLLYRVAKKSSNLLEGDPNIVDQIPVEVETSTSTITNQMAQNYASQLLDAFNSKEPFWGTDEKVVEAVFDQLKTPGDFAKVFDAFGNKDYNGYNSPPTGFFSNLDSYEPRNLVYWLREEIDPADGEVYNKVKSRVESTGLVF